MTNQEMFDKAVAGLASQGFAQCATGDGTCVYDDGTGRRCAWGWVDPATKGHDGIVRDLHLKGIGIAASLSEEQLTFASDLQGAHDGIGTRGMIRRLRNLAETYSLIIPAVLTES